jgi:hypothetical protein
LTRTTGEIVTDNVYSVKIPDELKTSFSEKILESINQSFQEVKQGLFDTSLDQYRSRILHEEKQTIQEIIELLRSNGQEKAVKLIEQWKEQQMLGDTT